MAFVFNPTSHYTTDQPSWFARRLSEIAGVALPMIAALVLAHASTRAAWAQSHDSEPDLHAVGRADTEPADVDISRLPELSSLGRFNPRVTVGALDLFGVEAAFGIELALKAGVVDLALRLEYVTTEFVEPLGGFWLQIGARPVFHTNRDTGFAVGGIFDARFGAYVQGGSGAAVFGGDLGVFFAWDNMWQLSLSFTAFSPITLPTAFLGVNLGFGVYLG